MFPIDFQVTWSKFKVKLLVFEKMLSAQCPLIPLLESCQTYYRECLESRSLENRCSLHMVKVKVKVLAFVQMLSARFLLTPLLESCQIWCNRCPFRRNVSYWFYGHICQGQTAGHLKKIVCSIFTCKTSTEFGTVNLPLESRCSLWFLGHVIKGQGQTADLHPKCCLLNTISYNPLLATQFDYREKVTGQSQISGLNLSIIRSIFMTYSVLAW